MSRLAAFSPKLVFQTAGLPNNDPSGDAPSWGLNLSTNIKTFKKDRVIFSTVYGEATAGLYDDSDKWLYSTGLPAKSGVGGGILAVSPGKFGIAVISPPLDAAGNSVPAHKAITDISNALEGNP